jgi:hypothetical protein
VQLLGARHGGERQPHLGEQPSRHLVEATAAGEAHEVGVEAHVGRADRPPVAVGDGPLGRRDVVVQRLQLAGTERRQRAHHRALDRAPQAVEVDEVVLVEHPDEDPAVQLVHEQALVGQQAEGLPQGVAGHPQHLHQLLLGQPAARWEVALGDAPPQHVGHPLGGAAPVEAGDLVRDGSQPGRGRVDIGHGPILTRIAGSRKV